MAHQPRPNARGVFQATDTWEFDGTAAPYNLLVDPEDGTTPRDAPLWVVFYVQGSWTYTTTSGRTTTTTGLPANVSLPVAITAITTAAGGFYVGW